jgi:hypothetical protein
VATLALRAHRAAMRRYRYVGPPELPDPSDPPGLVMRSSGDVASAIAALGGPCTFVVGLDGWLGLAPRRSEHVACAAGQDVLCAGEIELARTASGWRVMEVSNQSTGYCPEPSSWPALQAALDALGVEHGGCFTHAFRFRRCPQCGERNLIKDDWLECALCGAELAEEWNFAPPA